jgi:2-oxoisovalerate dehydrogenase E1 component alpha subunit
LYRRASGFGFPGVRVDGNDVLAVYAATTAALERARTGNGPTLIEAYTYRMGAHTTSDDPTKYRLADELEHWRLKDPIGRVRAYLTRSGSGEEAFFADVETEASDLAAALRAGCLALPDPRILDLFDYVYAEQTPYLIEQKERYAEYVASFEDVSQDAGLRQAQRDGQPQPAFPGGVH